jgi:hypothetical protein
MSADRLLVGLDANQRRAVQTDAGPLAIVAAAAVVVVPMPRPE